MKVLLVLALVALCVPLAGCAGGCGLNLPSAVISPPIAFVPSASPAALGYGQQTAGVQMLAPTGAVGCAPGFYAPMPVAAPAAPPCP